MTKDLSLISQSPDSDYLLLISAFLFQKFFMVASFHDLTLFQYHDCIGVSDRRESVGNGKYRSALHDSITATRANAHL